MPVQPTASVMTPRRRQQVTVYQRRPASRLTSWSLVLRRTTVVTPARRSQVIQGRIQRSVMGRLNFGRFFRMKTTKLCTHKTPKKRNISYITSLKFTIFWKKLPKSGKIAHFSRAPCNKLQFCKFAPEAQEKFAIFSLKHGHRAIQNGGRGTDGGAGAP